MTEDGAIALIWIVALLVALGLTVGAVAMIVRIVNAAREVDRLLKETLPSAVGVVHNTAAIKELEAVVAAAGPLLDATTAIKSATDAIRDKVDRLGTLLGSGARS